MKSIKFLGDSRRVMREFPDEARRHVGAQLYRVQEGKEPSDWKPFPAVEPGVREIRIK